MVQKSEESRRMAEILKEQAERPNLLPPRPSEDNWQPFPLRNEARSWSRGDARRAAMV